MDSGCSAIFFCMSCCRDFCSITVATDTAVGGFPCYGTGCRSRYGFCIAVGMGSVCLRRFRNLAFKNLVLWLLLSFVLILFFRNILCNTFLNSYIAIRGIRHCLRNFLIISCIRYICYFYISGISTNFYIFRYFCISGTFRIICTFCIIRFRRSKCRNFTGIAVTTITAMSYFSFSSCGCLFCYRIRIAMGYTKYTSTDATPCMTVFTSAFCFHMTDKSTEELLHAS